MHATDGSLLQDGQEKSIGRCDQADATATEVTTKAVLTTSVSARIPQPQCMTAVLLQLHTRVLLTHVIHVIVACGSKKTDANVQWGLQSL